MTNGKIIIREIKKEDNPQIEQVIKSCFPEFDIPLTGTAYEDSETTKMFESYNGDREVYYVLDLNGKVLGGAGIKALKDGDGSVCELQKMYFSPEIRGMGFGKFLFQKCLYTAKKLGYKKCYIETANQLKAAIHIYETYGFKHLREPLGNTGHYSCGIWMIKDL